MLKKFLAVLAMLYAAATFAAVDVNKATAADLDALKGVGPVMTKRILDERKKSKFKSWDDFIERVKGLGENTAGKLSAEGLTVNGDTYKAAAMTKKEEKQSARDEKKEAKAAAKEDKKEAKADKKDAKAEAKKDDKPVAVAAVPAKPASAAVPAKPATAAVPAKPAASAASAKK